MEDDDDDYEPNFYAAEDTEQILNKLDSAPPEELPEQNTDADASALTTLGPFKLPAPPPIDPDTASKLSQLTASRVFEPLTFLEEPTSRKPKAGINRLAASSYDRDAWLTMITRLATRSTSGLEVTSGRIKKEPETGFNQSGITLSNVIRESLYNYILEDWRKRIDVAVAWLCEEWYNDQLTKRSGVDGPLYYEKSVLRLLDGFLNYVTASDKMLTRFMSEIPEANREALGKLKGLCGDPTTVQLALSTLLYLVMMKPPSREIALDTVAEIWMECEFSLFQRSQLLKLTLFVS